MLNAEDEEVIALAKQDLVSYYQSFKLADSEETARLLVQHVEEEGVRQARRAKGKGH